MAARISDKELMLQVYPTVQWTYLRYIKRYIITIPAKETWLGWGRTENAAWKAAWIATQRDVQELLEN